MKMNMKAALFVALTSVAALTGCDDKTSVEWYMAHHDDMLKKYEECLNDGTWQADDCANANVAYKREKDKPDVVIGMKGITDRFNNK